MGYSERTISLNRDSRQTAWGFRLQGGRDYNAPLLVQRVFVGSPADRELQRGDVIIAVQGYDAISMLHGQALDIIKNSELSLHLSIASTKPEHTTSVSSRSVDNHQQQQHNHQQQQQYYQQQPQQPQQHQQQQYQPHHQQQQQQQHPQSPTKPHPPLPNPLYQAHPHSQPIIHLPPGEKPHPQNKPQIAGYKPVKSPISNQHQSTPAQVVNMQYPGSSYQQQQSGEMLDKVQRSLSNVTISSVHRQVPQQYQSANDYAVASIGYATPYMNQPVMFRPAEQIDEEPYHQKSISELKRSFNKPNEGQRVHCKPVGQLPRAWSKPTHPIETSPSVLEPGWSPSFISNTGSHNRTNKVTQNIGNSVAPRSAPQSRGKPAWHGSLRSSSDQYGTTPQTILPSYPMESSHAGQNVAVSHPFQPKAQNMHYNQEGQEYQQNDSYNHDNDSAQVVHLQYNTPIGLYNKNNVQGALDGQTSGRAGEGSLVIKGGNEKQFDPNTSCVLRLLREQEHQHPHMGHFVDPLAAREQVMHNEYSEDYGCSDF